MDADAIVNGYFSQNGANQDSNHPADSIVNRYFAKQQGSPHPLDDTYISKAQADAGDQSYNNYCEAFAEQVAYGRRGLYNTAADAWDNYAQQGKVESGNVQDAPRGAMIYFAPDASNYGDGHVGFSDGAGNLISATSQGVKSIPIAEWINQTKQKPLGYVIPNQ